jgi:hypothetical protein
MRAERVGRGEMIFLKFKKQMIITSSRLFTSSSFILSKLISNDSLILFCSSSYFCYKNSKDIMKQKEEKKRAVYSH